MSTATYSVRIGDEIYVYVRGHLVMKRWLKTGNSVTFHVAPNGTRWKEEGREGSGHFCEIRVVRRDARE